MHAAAYSAVAAFVAEHDLNQPDYVILEIGSADVNGSVRPLFAAVASYTGVDVREGRGVDVVASGAKYGAAEAYDVCVSTETLEHAATPDAIVRNAYRVLKPGGALLLTAAGPERVPHGNDGGDVGDEHYANIDPDDLKAWLTDAGFTAIAIEHNERDHDVYAFARKPKGRR